MTAFLMAIMLAKHSVRAFQTVPTIQRSTRGISIFAPSCSFSVGKEFGARRSVRLFSTSIDVDDLNEKIKAKGDQIRQLKADGVDKATLTPHVEELKALKSQLPTETTTESNVTPAKTSKASKTQKAPAVSSNKKGTEEMSESELRLNRISKIEAMREANVEPFEYTYDCTRTAAQLAAEYEGRLDDGAEDETSDVSVAGRIMTRRVFGKLAFFTMQDETGIVQLQFDKARLGDSFQVRSDVQKTCTVRVASSLMLIFCDCDSQGIKDWTDGGDIVGVRGTVRRTDKGELTVYAKEWKMLTKSILPLPDKYHGLQDITKRYRYRHVDMIVNPNVRETFRKRAKITSMMRRLLDEDGFLEIETPVLHTQSGGAEAKPFETYHNSMDMDLTLRIATELHLKRLIIGGFDKVYEIGRIFRNEGISTRHNPEFTSIELYQAYADYEDMMNLTESLVCCE